MENGSSVKHVLQIYNTRLKMLEKGIINPTPEGKEIILSVVNKLSKMSPNAKIFWDDHKMKDSSGNIIVEFPKQ